MGTRLQATGYWLQGRLPVLAMLAMLAAVGAAALGTAACGGGPNQAAAAATPGPAPREVQTVAVARAPLARVITVTGTLAAEEQAVLSTKVSGRVAALLVDLGSVVRTGQPLARLDATDFTLRVEQAEAALGQARARLGLDPRGGSDRVVAAETAIVRQARAVRDEARLTQERIQTFVARGLSARSDLDAANAALEVAEGRYQDALEEVLTRQALVSERRSALELARQQLADTTLTAPFDGVIRERTTSVGQYVAAGTPLATLVRMHPLRLRLEVPEREAASVRIGQPVRVLVEGREDTFEGRVARLSPAISESSRTLLVEAEVSNREHALRPGTFARAEIVLTEDDEALLVPISSIVTFAGIDKVFTVDGGRAREHRVRLGRRERDRVEVIEGLDAGVAVVVMPGNLVDGDAVRPN